MSRAGRQAASIMATGIGFSGVPMGLMTQFLISGLDGVNPSGTLNFSVYVSSMRKSMSTMRIIAMGTPKSPSARRACGNFLLNYFCNNLNRTRLVVHAGKQTMRASFQQNICIIDTHSFICSRPNNSVF